MSDIMDMITSQLSGEAMKQISRQLGTNEQQSSSANAAALPVLLGAMNKNAKTSEGASALAGALEKDHDGSILDNLGGFLGNASQGPGAGILGHVLGGQRGKVEQYVSKTSGLNTQGSGQLLEMLAPVVMGALGKQKREQGLDAGALAGMLGNVMSNRQSQAPQQNQILGALLDSDGDGDITDDIVNLGGKLLGGLFKR